PCSNKGDRNSNSKVLSPLFEDFLHVDDPRERLAGGVGAVGDRHDHGEGTGGRVAAGNRARDETVARIDIQSGRQAGGGIAQGAGWRVSGECRFATFDTTRSEMHRLLTRCRPSVVIIEACLLAGWVHDLCADLGFRCLVANTASEAWKFKHLKRKTDKDDALRLAQLHALGQLPTVALPPPATRQWRALTAYRQSLVGRRVAVQNRLRALFVAQGLPAPRGHRAWTATGLDGLALQGKPLADCGPGELWRGLLALALAEYRQLVELLQDAERRLDDLAKADKDVQPVETTPGVGPRTAEAIVAHLHQPERFANGKQVSAY